MPNLIKKKALETLFLAKTGLMTTKEWSNNLNVKDSRVSAMQCINQSAVQFFYHPAQSYCENDRSKRRFHLKEISQNSILWHR